MLRDGFHQDAVHGGVAPYQPELAGRRHARSLAGAADGGFVDVPEPVAAAVKERRAAGELRRPLQPGDACSTARCRRSSRTTSSTPTPSSCRKLLRADDPRAPAAGAGQHRRRPVRAGRGRARAARARRPTDRRRRPRAQRGDHPARRHLAGRRAPSSASSSGRQRHRGRRRPCGRRCSRPRRCRWSSAPTGGEHGRVDGAAHLRQRRLDRVRRRSSLVGRPAAGGRRAAQHRRQERGRRPRRSSSTRGSSSWSARPGGTRRPSVPWTPTTRSPCAACRTPRPGVVTGRPRTPSPAGC